MNYIVCVRDNKGTGRPVQGWSFSDSLWDKKKQYDANVVWRLTRTSLFFCSSVENGHYCVLCSTLRWLCICRLLVIVTEYLLNFEYQWIKRRHFVVTKLYSQSKSFWDYFVLEPTHLDTEIVKCWSSSLYLISQSVSFCGLSFPAKFRLSRRLLVFAAEHQHDIKKTASMTLWSSARDLPCCILNSLPLLKSGQREKACFEQQTFFYLLT